MLIWLPLSLTCQDSDKLIREIDSKLAKGQISISNLLSDSSYNILHSQTPFRETIKKYARTGKIRITCDSEPGKKITVRGQMEIDHGPPIADALIYVYHTSDKGWYSDTAAHIFTREGDMRHARLFAYMKTDMNGQFEFETIQPKGYPKSDLPAHIHIMAWKDGELMSGVPGELLFDDDPRLTTERRSSSLREGFLIQKNSGTAQHPVYYYKIVMSK